MGRPITFLAIMVVLSFSIDLYAVKKKKTVITNTVPEQKIEETDTDDMEEDMLFEEETPPKEQQPEPIVEIPILPESVPIKKTVLDREVVETVDSNNDGISEIKKYYKFNSKGDKILVKKEIDINGDGKIDYVIYYDNKSPGDEKVAKILVDNDFDGKFDEIRYYNPESGKLMQKEYDLNFDGKPDLTKRYYNGELVKKEADTNFNGIIDYWEYYQDGKLVRTEVDTNGDGKPDKVGKSQIQEVYKFDIDDLAKTPSKAKKKTKAKINE